MRIVILGGGPTGLSAAHRCSELGLDWRLYEAKGFPGGLAASFTANGFTWDLGGHVVFSHYDDFDALLDQLIPEDQWFYHRRRAFIYMIRQWVPYPFQNNIHYLPEREREECLAGLSLLPGEGRGDVRTLDDWINTHAGAGIARLFLRPYNDKVWAHPTQMLSASWLGDRVARPDAEKIKEKIRQEREDDDWGPNRLFRFPCHGGTGSIWQRLADLLPAERVSYCHKASSIDVGTKRVEFSNGSIADYDYLISTIPLDELAAMAGLQRNAAARLLFNSVYVVGVGLQGACADTGRDKTWIYFPEPTDPFYRVTVFSNYSHFNAPPGYSSLMAEVSESCHRPVDRSRLVAECVSALHRSCLISASQEVIHTWVRRIPKAYPVPSTGRDEALSALLPALRERGVLSRGRFGGWKYEVGNMDHSFAQGREAVNSIALGEQEDTLSNPNKVNAQCSTLLEHRVAARLAGGS